DDVFETGEDTDEDTRVMKKNISLHHQTQTSLNLLIKKLKNQNLTLVMISRSLTTFCHSLKGGWSSISGRSPEFFSTGLVKNNRHNMNMPLSLMLTSRLPLKVIMRKILIKGSNLTKLLM
ncbi:hypothetical protein Tco_0329862, partial [Tanacetum coccineum]